MRSIFGLGKKVQQKLTAERFHFSFTIHQLSPWPGGNKSLAIGWQSELFRMRSSLDQAV